MTVSRWRRGSVAALAALILPACDRSPEIIHYVLALSWQPTFCEFNAGRTECRALRPGDFAARNLTVHGLWPNDRPGGGPSYCGVDAAARALDQPEQWCALPEPEVSARTRAALAAAMPGAASCLDRHQWTKHGTCAGMEAEAYFAATLRLAEAVQASQLGQVVAANVGRNVTPRQLSNAFEAAFGAGAGGALTLVCSARNGREYLAEIRIALQPGALDGALERGSLYLDGEPPAGSCGDTIRIDSAGH